MSRVKSVKIWSRGEMDDNLFQFGWRCFEQFKNDCDSVRYGEDWCECAYSNDYYVAWSRLTKSGQASVMVGHNPH